MFPANVHEMTDPSMLGAGPDGYLPPHIAHEAYTQFIHVAVNGQYVTEELSPGMPDAGMTTNVHVPCSYHFDPLFMGGGSGSTSNNSSNPMAAYSSYMLQGYPRMDYPITPLTRAQSAPNSLLANNTTANSYHPIAMRSVSAHATSVVDISTESSSLLSYPPSSSPFNALRSWVGRRSPPRAHMQMGTESHPYSAGLRRHARSVSMFSEAHKQFSSFEHYSYHP
jgi:hypothetical protein